MRADRIVVEKSARTMTLMQGAKVLKTYKVALSRKPVGAKEREGDHKVPEGEYVVDSKNSHSRFHLALHISYPNDADRQRAHKQGKHLGSLIAIHGTPDFIERMQDAGEHPDWTAGCIGVRNSEIEEIYALVPVGTPIEIKP